MSNYLKQTISAFLSWVMKQDKAPLKDNLSHSQTFSMHQLPDKPKAVVHYPTIDFCMVSAQASPIHCIHQRLFWDW